MKDGEGINQREFMHNPWTWTTTWGGERVGLGGGGEREKKTGTTVTAETIKIIFFKLKIKK